MTDTNNRDTTFGSQSKTIVAGMYIVTMNGKPVKGPLADVGWLLKFQPGNDDSVREREFLMSEMKNKNNAYAHADVQEWNEYHQLVKVPVDGSFTIRPFQREGSAAHLVSMHASLRPATQAEIAANPHLVKEL